MQGKRDGEITRLLGAFSNGEPEAEARLMDLTYRELRKIAAGHMRRERSARSLQTSDLVHEAYLRLVDQAATPWRDRAHFFQVAAHVMRQILIDRARKRFRSRRFVVRDHKRHRSTFFKRINRERRVSRRSRHRSQRIKVVEGKN